MKTSKLQKDFGKPSDESLKIKTKPRKGSRCNNLTLIENRIGERTMFIILAYDVLAKSFYTVNHEFFIYDDAVHYLTLLMACVKLASMPHVFCIKYVSKN